MPRSNDSGEGTQFDGRIRTDLQQHSLNVRTAVSEFEQWSDQWIDTRSKLDALLAKLTSRLQPC